MNTYEAINGTTKSQSRNRVAPGVLCAGIAAPDPSQNTIRARPLQELLNLDELMERIDNDQELLAEILGLLQTEFPILHNALRSAVDGCDLQRVQIAAHGLKGMLANLAITRGAAAAAQIEETARSGNRNDLLAEMSVLDQETESLLPSVEAYLAGAKP